MPDPAVVDPAVPDPGVPRVVAVVVSYNRRDLLIEGLNAIYSQSRRPDAVIVVDNASTDGSAAAARSHFPEARVVELAMNYGGAGGFAYGMALALAQGAGLIWVMDDDTVPEPGALEAMLGARASYQGTPPVLLASRVVWTDGRDHPMNSPRPKPLARQAERTIAAAAGCTPIRSASFVSVLVDAQECRRRGLPRADFFLWNDDFEFTTRLLRGQVGLLCPASVVVHKTRAFGSTDVDPGERFFFEVRNKIWTFRSGSLAPVEKVLYGVSTLRRWVLTYTKSADRGALRSAFGRGIAAGWRSSPRPNEEVLPPLLASVDEADQVGQQG